MKSIIFFADPSIVCSCPEGSSDSAIQKSVREVSLKVTKLKMWVSREKEGEVGPKDLQYMAPEPESHSIRQCRKLL